MFKRYLIKLLFKLLGNDHKQLYSIKYLYGVHSSGEHKDRIKRWESSLIRLWKDKDLIDYLYYMAESDKEKYWRGGKDNKINQGARIRTMFLVNEAKRAYKERLKGKKKIDVEKKGRIAKEISEDSKNYKGLVDIH